MRAVMLHPEAHLVSRIGWLRAAVLGTTNGIASTAMLSPPLVMPSRSRKPMALRSQERCSDHRVMAAGRNSRLTTLPVTSFRSRIPNRMIWQRISRAVGVSRSMRPIPRICPDLMPISIAMGHSSHYWKQLSVSRRLKPLAISERRALGLPQ